jgi:hypothetical protein
MTILAVGIDLIASEATATGDRRGAAICRTCFHPATAGKC